MELKDIVLKLVGEVRPVGETNSDSVSFESLKELCRLTSELVDVIDSVGYDFKDSYEYSVKRSSEYAQNFLTETIGITE